MRKKKPAIKVRRIADRRYRDFYFTESGRMVGLDLISPAEYGVFVGDEQVARIIKTRDGWRIIQPTPTSKFGVAISPVGLNKFSYVKQYALKKFTPPLSKQAVQKRKRATNAREGRVTAT